MAYWTVNDDPIGSSGGGVISRLSTSSQTMTPTTATSAATTALAAPPAHRVRTFTVRFGPEDGGAGVPMTALRWSQDRLSATPPSLEVAPPCRHHPLGVIRRASRRGRVVLRALVITGRSCGRSSDGHLYEMMRVI